MVHPLRTCTSYTWDSSRVERPPDPRGERTTLPYASLSYETKGPKAIAPRLGGRFSCLYDSSGRIKAVVDPLGTRSTLLWDAGGNCMVLADPSGFRTSYAYGGAGQTTTVKTGKPRVERARRGPERQLIAACITGAQTALEELIEGYRAAVLAAAAKALRAGSVRRVSATAEDLAHEFLLELLEHPQSIFRRFEGYDGPLGTWLFGMAFRRCLMMLRSPRHRWPGRKPIMLTLNLDTLPDRKVHEPHPADRLDRVLERLSPQSRVIIKACFGCGPFGESMKVREIAKRYGWSVPTTYRRIAQALECLPELGESPRDE